MMICSVCDGTDFADNAVLWDGLCDEWQIGPVERAYIDRQQGTCCTACGANLRSIVLARAILRTHRAEGPLRSWVRTPEAAGLHVLELNGAGTLTPVLSDIPGHVAANYPDVDMHALPYPEATFDLVVHSDSLEHVANPVHALAECRRVLKAGGSLAFTVPVIFSRMTRDRLGLPPSYHGAPNTKASDYAVVTEYGADMWTHVVLAGFEAVQIHTLDYPSATAITAVA